MRAHRRLGGTVVGAALVLALAVTPAYADPTATPTPGPTPSAAPTPTPTPEAAPTPTDPSVTPTPTPSESPTTSGTPTPTGAPTKAVPKPQAQQAPGLTLEVGSTYGNGSAFWSDLGAYAFRGSASGLDDGSLVEVFWRGGSDGGWNRLAGGRTDDSAYAIDVPVLGHGTFGFIATSGGAPGSGDETRSNIVTVTVGNSRVIFNRPVARIDALKDPRVSGSVVPARSGVTINFDVLRNGRFVKVGQTKTDSAGRYATSFGYGRGRLASYRVRTTYRVPNRARYEAALSHRITRVAVLNPVITATTAAEVAKTYRDGCPVGPSRLRTVAMNYYGNDKKMHRGVIIIRSDLTGEVAYAFSRALSVRFPLTKMRNPNAYGGSDPVQMRADNSSGFNCRSVVGNPYRQSPHSYGIAIDVNPRQNPYRDRNGKWWPENGTGYIDRTPRRGGMLNTKSTLTRVLRDEGFFWGGLWSPGRDYQHFQYE